MALSTVTRRLVRTTTSLRGVTPPGVPRAVPRALPWATQRRHMNGHQLGKYGPKMQAKIDEADRAWEERAQRIRDGLEPNLWDTFRERGLVKDVTGTDEAMGALMRDRRIGAYVGIDPTAPSLHLGHLLPMMPLFWMYMNGYRAVTLMGGATARIGDPTGRLTSREKMRHEELTRNLLHIHYQLKRIWVNVDAQARRYGYKKEWAWRRGIMQNSHWWNKLPVMEFMMRLGRFMRIGPMLSRDTVKTKMSKGDGMSFSEFTYPLMQAWDWWHLYFTGGVQMQIGGSDQWGNIVAGAEAFKVMRESEPDPMRRVPRTSELDDPAGFTVPLLTDSAGNKFGKSAGNALWLDKFRTPSYELYGYFMRRPDTELEKLLNLFTFLPKDRVALIMARHSENPSLRIANHIVAFEVLALTESIGEAAYTRAQHFARHQTEDAVAHALDELEAPKKVPRNYKSRDVEAAFKAETGVAGESFTPRDYGADGGELVADAEYLRREQERFEDEQLAAAEAEFDAQYGPAGTPGASGLASHEAPRVDMQLPRSLIDEGKIARILYAAGLVPSISEGQRVAVRKGAYVGSRPGVTAKNNRGMIGTQIDYTPVHLWYPEDTKKFLIGDKYLLLRKGKHNVRMIEIVSDEQWKASGKTYPGEPNTGRIRRLRKELEELRELSQMRVEMKAQIDAEDADRDTLDTPGSFESKFGLDTATRPKASPSPAQARKLAEVERNIRKVRATIAEKNGHQIMKDEVESWRKAGTIGGQASPNAEDKNDDTK